MSRHRSQHRLAYPRRPSVWRYTVAALWLCGCVQQMANQPRLETYETATFFADGQSVRKPITGTVARNDLVQDTVMETRQSTGQPVTRIPLEMTLPLVNRGQDRFQIYCAPCHGPAGYGNGLVVQRGFPAPPSYHIDRLRNAPPGRIFQVVTDGHGRMPAFGKRLTTHDRWAVVAYVRALQRSQYADAGQLSTEDRQALDSHNDHNDHNHLNDGEVP